MFERVRIYSAIFVATFAIAAYWHLAIASPLNPASSSNIAEKLPYQAVFYKDKSREDNSREDDSRERSNSGDKSDENSAEVDFIVVSVSNKSGVVEGKVVAKGEKKLPPGSVDSDMEVIYFTDGNDDANTAGGSGAGTTELPSVGNIPCKNNRHQFYRDSDRCNGIYDCDETSDDETNCPSKCQGFRYDKKVFLDCRAYIPRFYYDFEKNTCVPFGYGGCAKVVNMFLSKGECERECKVAKPADSRADFSTSTTTFAETTTVPNLETTTTTEKIVTESIGNKVVVESASSVAFDSTTTTEAVDTTTAEKVEEIPTTEMPIAAGPVDA